jgi:hypothetical protein
LSVADPVEDIRISALRVEAVDDICAAVATALASLPALLRQHGHS